jgi:hypothetical protein
VRVRPPKAEDALLNAIEDDPVCGELREALRGVYQARGGTEGFVEETLVLAALSVPLLPGIPTSLVLQSFGTEAKADKRSYLVAPVQRPPALSLE